MNKDDAYEELSDVYDLYINFNLNFFTCKINQLFLRCQIVPR